MNESMRTRDAKQAPSTSRTHAELAAAAMLALLAGCGATEPHPHPPERGGSRCALPPSPRKAWRHHSLGVLLAGRTAAHHVAFDALVPAQQNGDLRGKFAYGPTSKDLEDEYVEAYWFERDCTPHHLGTALTDADGRVQFALPPLAAGAYQAALRVSGDGAIAHANMYVVAANATAVLFDIDGTLTNDDGELFEDLLGGTADMRPAANQTAARFAAAGHTVVYMTGRPYFLREHTIAWLQQRGFPPGPVFTVDHMQQTLPTASGVGTWKTQQLQRLVASGVTFARAYGNASTDVCAYVRAGFAPANIFILGRSTPPTCDGQAVQALPSYTTPH